MALGAIRGILRLLVLQVGNTGCCHGPAQGHGYGDGWCHSQRQKRVNGFHRRQ